MNRNDMLGQFEHKNTQLNTMIEAIPNFKKRDEKFMLNKASKYYNRLQLISTLIQKNRTMPELCVSTFDIEKKVKYARELLLIEFQKRDIPNKWDPLLPNLDSFQW